MPVNMPWMATSIQIIKHDLYDLTILEHKWDAVDTVDGRVCSGNTNAESCVKWSDFLRYVCHTIDNCSKVVLDHTAINIERGRVG